MELSLETSKLLVGAKVGIAVPPPVGERVSLLVDEGLVVGGSVMTWSVALDDDGAVVGTSVVLDTVGDAVSLEILVGERVSLLVDKGLVVGDSVMTWSVALDDGAVVGTSVVLDTVGDAVSLEILVGDRVVAFAESTVGLAVSLLATVGISVMFGLVEGLGVLLTSVPFKVGLDVEVNAVGDSVVLLGLGVVGLMVSSIILSLVGNAVAFIVFNVGL